MPAIPPSRRPACDDNVNAVMTVRFFAVLGVTCSLRLLYQVTRWIMQSDCGSIVNRKSHHLRIASMPFLSNLEPPSRSEHERWH